MEQDKREETDPELDIFNKNFKPEKYLAAPGPSKVVKSTLFDNFNNFTQALKMADNKISTKILSPVIRKPNAKVGEAEQEPSESVRKFLPHQQLVKRERSVRFSKNILTSYEKPDGTAVKAFLKPFMDTKTRVKIYTRKEKGVRGIVTGVIVAFDKHWNIVLEDAVETWRRRKFAFSESKIAGLAPMPPTFAVERLTAMGIKVPEVTAKSVDRKYVECTRRIPQFMIRGEQVVLVARDSSLF